jgi:hypothetical protein
MDGCDTKPLTAAGTCTFLIDMKNSPPIGTQLGTISVIDPAGPPADNLQVPMQAGALIILPNPNPDDFGTVPRGMTKTNTFTVLNAGTAAVTFTSNSIGNAGNYPSSWAPGPGGNAGDCSIVGAATTTLNPNGSCNMYIVFQPSLRLPTGLQPEELSILGPNGAPLAYLSVTGNAVP